LQSPFVQVLNCFLNLFTAKYELRRKMSSAASISLEMLSRNSLNRQRSRTVARDKFIAVRKRLLSLIGISCRLTTEAGSFALTHPTQRKRVLAGKPVLDAPFLPTLGKPVLGAP
jgi:preprotein translocase subunit Sec63